MLRWPEEAILVAQALLLTNANRPALVPSLELIARGTSGAACERSAIPSFWNLILFQSLD
jgi:hypothetical protein